MGALFQTQPGAGTRTARTPLGPVISARRRARWRHPWQTALTWAAESAQWVATVKPGFVNHACPAVRTLIVNQQADTGTAWGNNPLTGKPFFSDPIFAQPLAANAASGWVDVPLYLQPAIRLAWRAIGWDSGSEEAPPRFFLDRGAAMAPDLEAALAKLDETSGLPQAPAGLRLLRACDLWVHQPRAALTAQVTVEPGLTTGLHNYTQTLSFTLPLANDALRVMSGTMESAFSAAIDPLAQDYAEQPWDELLVARVYVLSPADTAPGSAPDATWTPYASHAQFWNLTYVPAQWRQPLGGTDPGVSLFVPLAGGLAQPVINVFTSTLNDATSQAQNALSAQSLTGTFYTATGGGSDAVMPSYLRRTPQVAGADKTGRIQAETRAAAAVVTQARLDPDFPFRAPPFNPAVLTTPAI